MAKFDIKESNRIEFKRELNDKLEKEIVAFLNYREDGTVYIGIDDEGSVIGIQSVDNVQLKIKDRLKNNIMPSTMGLFDVYVRHMEIKITLKLMLPVARKSLIT